MASSKYNTPVFCLAFIWLTLFAKSCNGVQFLGSNTYRLFSIGDEIYVKVNSVTSVQTLIPFSYYSLPYCITKFGIQVSEMNLGQLLLGHQMLNSVYRFQMNVNETVYLCTTPPLKADEVKLMRQKVHDLYKVNMFLDDLPVKNGLIANEGRTGFPVGYATAYNDNGYYIFNHLNFQVQIHEHEEQQSFDIVGFKVVPCSAKHNPEAVSKHSMYDNVQPIYCSLNLKDLQVIRENETISFTFNVEFVNSDTTWDSRWDAYLEIGNNEIRFNSVFYSVITVLFLKSLMIAVYFKRLRRELNKVKLTVGIEDEVELKVDQSNPMIMINDVTSWKVIIGDIFREPKCAKLLCIMVGEGIRIILTALTIVLIFFSSVIVTPALKGILLITIISLYLVYGFTAGYIAVRLWRTIKGTSTRWRSVSLCVSCYFSGLVFFVLSCSNIFYYHANCTKAIPMSSFLIILFLWIFVSVPLTLIGGYIGSTKDHIQYPVKTNQVARQIPGRKYLAWLLVIGAGIFPFGTLFIELFYMLSDTFFGGLSPEFGYLGVSFVMLILVCAILSVIITFTRLQVEDWQWWWKAFFASGSVGIYVLCYSINYLVYDLRGLDGPVAVGVYISYSLIVAIAVMLSAGAVGFIVSFYFVHRLYSSFKVGC